MKDPQQALDVAKAADAFIMNAGSNYSDRASLFWVENLFTAFLWFYCSIND